MADGGYFLGFFPLQLRAEAALFEQANGIRFIPLWNMKPAVAGLLGVPAVAVWPATAGRVRQLLASVVVERGPPFDTPRWVRRMAMMMVAACEAAQRPGVPPMDAFAMLVRARQHAHPEATDSNGHAPQLAVHLALCHASALSYLLEGFGALHALFQQHAKELRLILRYSVAWKLVLVREDSALGLDPYACDGWTTDRKHAQHRARAARPCSLTD